MTSVKRISLLVFALYGLIVFTACGFVLNNVPLLRKGILMYIFGIVVSVTFRLSLDPLGEFIKRRLDRHNPAEK